MKKLRSILRLPGFHVLLFSLCLVLFGWPLLTIAEKEHGEAIFSYLFLVWGITIVLLFLVARSLSMRDSGETKEINEEE